MSLPDGRSDPEAVLAVRLRNAGIGSVSPFADPPRPPALAQRGITGRLQTIVLFKPGQPAEEGREVAPGGSRTGNLAAIRPARSSGATPSKRITTEEAIHQAMRATALLLLSTAALLIGCSSKPPEERSTSESHVPVVGSDRDAHGCIPSAGYRWCATTNQCERPWDLAKSKGFEPTPEAFEQYCQSKTQRGRN